MIKLKSYYFTCFLSLLFLFGGCVKELAPLDGAVIEGEPTTINLVLDVMEADIQTRMTPEDQLKLINLYILIFNKDGDVDARHFIQNPTTEKLNDLAVKSGDNKSIFVVANVNDLIVSITSDQLDAVTNLADFKQLRPKLEQSVTSRGLRLLMSGFPKDEDGNVNKIAIPTGNNAKVEVNLSQLDALVTFNIKTSSPNHTFRIRNYTIVNATHSTPIAFEAKDTPDSELSGITYSALPSVPTSVVDGKTSFSFYILPNSMTEKSTISNDYEGTIYDINGTPIENPVASDIAQANYSLRSQSEGTAAIGNNPTFKYANENSTYIIIKGRLFYPIYDPIDTDKTIGSMDAVAEYYIHLGYLGNDANDYSTNGNTNYTYDVTINTANNIIVESQSESANEIERQSGVEGTVEFAKTKINLDACYETENFVFNKELFKADAIPAYEIVNGQDVDMLNGDMFFWYNQTPFQEYVVSYLLNSQTRPVEEILDFDWTYFLLSDKRDEVTQNYRDAFAGYTNEIYMPEDPYGLNFDPLTYLDSGKDKLITIAQLTKLFNYFGDKNADVLNLKESVGAGVDLAKNIFDGEGNAVFTVFTREFFYTEDPTKPNITQAEKRLLWKKFVNKDPRAMGISTSLDISPDIESYYLTSELSIFQTSIATIYNPDAELTELVTAWGSERYITLFQRNGLTRIPFGDIKDGMVAKADNKQNGLINTLEMIMETDQNWGGLIDPDVNALQNSYQKVQYACLQRNRDVNADGVIDRDEVKWYLASINQLSDLWIGEPALEGVRLYANATGPYQTFKPNDYEDHSPWGEEFYASSTLSAGANNSKNYFRLWASEGSSIDVVKTTEGVRSYRCLRDLGFNDSERIEGDKTNATITMPQDFVVYNDATREFDVKYLNPVAYRTYYSLDRALPTHNGRSEHNRPWNKFQVAPYGAPTEEGIKTDILDWEAMMVAIVNGEKFCPDGYRIPNQRELALMATRIPYTYNADTQPKPSWFPPHVTDGQYVFSSTGFIYNGFEVDGEPPVVRRPAYAAVNLVSTHSLNLTLLSHGKLAAGDIPANPDAHSNCEGGVRCVRDQIIGVDYN